VAAPGRGVGTDAATPRSTQRPPGDLPLPRPEATDTVHGVIGQRPFRRVLVLGRIAQATRAEMLARATDRGVDQMGFAEVLAALIAGTDVNRSGDNPPST
jgi:phage-related baseplate assembly protein